MATSTPIQEKYEKMSHAMVTPLANGVAQSKPHVGENQSNGTSSKESHHKIPASEVHKTLASHILADGYHVIIDLERSHGSYIFDSSTQQEILDMYTSFATLPLGYNHPKLFSEDFVRKLLPSALNKPANSDIYTVEYAEFVDKFSTVLPVPLRDHIFFIEGGTQATENAVKTAFDWKVRKNLKAGKPPKGQQIIHLKECFHGRSGYCLSLTNTDPKKILYFPKFIWPRVTNPKLNFSHGKVTPETLAAVKELEKQSIEEIERAVAENPDDIAALIIEPIQGEGGDNHMRPEYFQELRRLADKHEFLLIFDEVQTGFGTTGKWWAHEYFGVTPDILAFGKKTQVCGIAASHRLDEVESVFHVSSRINSTWGGNLVDMVRCTKFIEIMQEENLIENSAQVGEKLLRGLIMLEEKFPGKVTNARGRGVFCAVDLPDTDTRNKAIKAMTHNNLLCLTSGSRSIRVRPPLTLTAQEAEAAIQKMDHAFTELFGGTN